VLHEAVHRAADSVLMNKSHPLTRRLDALRTNLLKSMPATTYGLSNVRELLAEGMTNPVFRRDLSLINVNGEKISAWQKFKNIMHGFLRSIMGGPTPGPGSARSEIDAIFDAILASNPNEVMSGEILGASFSMDGARNVLDRVHANTRRPTKADMERVGKVLADKKIPPGWKGMFLRLFVPLDYLSASAEKYMPSAREVHDLIQQHKARTQHVLEKVTQTVSSISRALNKHRRDQSIVDDFNRVLSQGSLTGVDARKPRSAYEGYGYRYNVLDADGNITGIVESPRYATVPERDEALRAYNAKLPEGTPAKARARQGFEQTDTMLEDYDRIRAAYDRLPADLRPAINRAFALPLAISEDLTAAIKARLASLLPEDYHLQNKIFGAIYSRMLSGMNIDPYQPLRREGEYWLSYSAMDPETGTVDTFKHSFHTVEQRNHAIRMLEALPADQQVSGIVSYQNPGERKAQPRVAMEFVADVLDAIDGSEVLKQVDNGALRGEIINLMFDNMPETSFVHSFRRRQGVRGFIGDFGPVTDGLTAGDTIKNLQKGSERVARQAADLHYGAKFAATRSKLKKEFDEFQHREIPGMSNVQRSNENAIAEQYHKVLDDYTGVAFRQRSKWARRVVGGAYMMTLGFNASTALITLAQIPMVVTPYLSGKYNVRGTVAAIGEASRLLTSSGRERPVTRIGEDGQLETHRARVYRWDYSLNNYDFTKPENAYLKELHDVAEFNGLFNRSLVQDELLGETATPTEKVAAISGMMQHHAERYSRETSLMAAYFLELQQRMGNSDAMGDFIAKLRSGEVMADPDMARAAAKVAVDLSETTNGPIYAAGGPLASNNDLGSVLYLFKRHPLSMINLLAQTAIRSAGPNTEDRRIARRQAAGLFGMLGLMSGVMGLPLIQQIGWLWDMMFTDDDDLDFESTLRTSLGEAGSYGLLDYMTGLKVSERIGYGDAIYRPGFASDNLPTYARLVEGFGGPVVGLGIKYSDRVRKLIGEEEYWRAGEAAAPTALANMMRAIRFHNEGIRTMRYDPIVEDVGPFSTTAQALGFMSAPYAQQLAANAAGTRINNAIASKRTNLMRQRYVALRKGDAARAQEIMARIQEFNQAHPYYPITPADLRASLRSHEDTSARTHSGVAFNPKIDAYIRDLTAQFGPATIRG